MGRESSRDPSNGHASTDTSSAPGARTAGRLLIVDDDPDMCRLLAADLTQQGFDVLCQTSPVSALSVVDTGGVETILADVNMEGMNGLELCQRVATSHPDVPVVLLTALDTLETAVAALRARAYDFIVKPPDVAALASSLSRAVKQHRLGKEVRRLRQAVDVARGFGDLLGGTPKMQQLRNLLERVAESDAAVLLTGESGTGKELVARALHRYGRRSSGSFVAINCAAVPAALLESELFGHVKGAFTDARNARSGLFLQASGGTLFLDEVGDLPLELQPKLLRALQERAVRPLGADAEVPTDVRLIAATNRDLEAEMKAGRFREDLYFRINVIHVEVPPLRDRLDDVLLLAQHFVVACAARSGKQMLHLSPAAAERLVTYSWPGNVRELQNCIERAVALARYEDIRVDDLPERIRPYRAVPVVVGSEDVAELASLADIEQQYILRVLEAVKGNRRMAAKLLQVDRKTLYRKLERYAARR